MYNKKLFIIYSFTACLLFPYLSYADVHDRNIRQGKVKSEYDIGKGTGSNWLHLKYLNNGLYGDEGCLFDASASPTFSCPGRRGSSAVWGGNTQIRNACNGDQTPIGDSWLGCLSYDSSPYFQIGNPGNNYWVISANNDPAFDQCRKGPPSLSEEISNHSFQPEKLYNVSSNAYLDFNQFLYELRIKINASKHNYNCNGQFEHSIPFLSIGSHYGRGNPNYLGTLNRNGTGEDNLKFSMRISDYTPFSCNNPGCSSPNSPGVYAGFFVSAEWSNPANPGDPSVMYPKFAWIPLFGEGFFDGYTSATGGNKWNWPIFDSMFWPGAALGGMGSDQATSACPGVTIPSLNSNGAWSTYNIDLTKLYECLGDSPDDLLPTLPNGNINIIGVHFMMEAGHSSEGELEVALRNIRID